MPAAPVQVFGYWDDAEGADAEGTVTFQRHADIQDFGNAVVRAQIERTTLAAGAIATEILGEDGDPNALAGFYRVTERIKGTPRAVVYDIEVHAGDGPIDLRQVARVESLPAPNYAYEPAGTTEAERLRAMAAEEILANAIAAIGEGPAGEPGADGRAIELRTDGGFIQWRYAGEPTWIDLVDLDVITGPAGAPGQDGAPGAPGQDGAQGLQGDPGEPGADGADGAPGTQGDPGEPGADGADGSDGAPGVDGTDGREVELAADATHIRWRYAGDVGYTPLVTLEALRGPAGADGADGAPGPLLPDVVLLDSSYGDTGRTVHVSATEPAGATDGDIWLDPSRGSSLAVPPTPLAPATTFVVVGDSYAHVSGTQSYATGAVRGPLGITQWFEGFMGGRVRPLANAGVNGDSTPQVAARFTTDVLSYGPSFVLLATAGINDVKGTTTVAAHQAALTSIFNQARAAGALVLTFTIPPAVLVDTLAERQKLFTMNRWLLDQAATRPGLIVVDVFSLVVDQASTTTTAWRAALGTDGTHPNVAGSVLIGKALADAMAPYAAASGSRVGSSLADPYELLPNPLLIGNTAGVATATTIVGGTGTASKVARTDNKAGEIQRWAQTTGTNTILQTATTGFAPGDLVVARCEIRAEAVTAATSHFVALESRNASNVVLGSVSTNLGANGDMPNFDWITVELNPYLVPATATSLRWYNRLAGAGTIEIRNPSLRKVGT